jgi:hypothetical protein
MSPEATAWAEAPFDRERLEAALSAELASGRFASLASGCVWRQALPSLLLWVDAWRRLPWWLTWGAALAWGGFSALAVCFAALAFRWHRRAEAAWPPARQVRRVHLSRGPHGLPSSATVLLHMAAPISAALWLRALAPDLLAPSTVSLSLRAWIALVALAAMAKGFDLVLGDDRG